MKQAWTAQLFLKIHAHVGKYPMFDRLMIYTAHYLLIVLVFVLVYEWWHTGMFASRVTLFGALFVAAFAVSYTIALIWYRPRPALQLHGIKTRIKTLGTWKSFPSDHTIAATLLAYGAFLTFSGWALTVFCMLAALVAMSRVWVGVHYPRDIFGGIAIAGIIVAIAEKFLS